MCCYEDGLWCVGLCKQSCYVWVDGIDVQQYVVFWCVDVILCVVVSSN